MTLDSFKGRLTFSMDVIIMRYQQWSHTGTTTRELQGEIREPIMGLSAYFNS